MKKMKAKKLFTGLLSLMLIGTSVPFSSVILSRADIPASAETNSYDCLTYDFLEDGTIEITDCDYAATEVEIPAEIDGVAVTSIGQSAFSWCSDLSTVTIPDGVTEIGAYAFEGCYNLSAVTIPDGVTEIGAYAFNCCSNLSAVTIPDSVTEIGEYAFYDCSNLSTVTIPNSVTEIGEYAFYDCFNLSTITIPDSVTEIGEYTFYDCSNLSAVTIPDSITEIGKYAFYSCTSLTSVSIGSNLTNINDYAFANCKSLVDFDVSENNPQYVSKDGILFTNSTFPTLICYPAGKTDASYLLPDNTIIAEGAFFGCSYLQKINVNETDDGYFTIDGVLFSFAAEDPETIFLICYPPGKTDTSYTIPDGTNFIENGAFCDCNYLESITLSDDLIEFFSASGSKYALSIGDFEYCSNLKSITVPNTNTEFASYDGILYNKDLTTILCIPKAISECTFSKYLKTIPDSTCYNYTNLTHITIPENVQDLGANAFAGCTNLENVTIESGLKTIELAAFSDCTSLTDIFIPDSVTYINVDEGAFSGCTNLTSINVAEGNETYASFDGILYNKELTSIKKVPQAITECEISSNMTSLQDYTFGNCDKLTTITIPNSIVSIGYGEFAYCTSLTDVYYNGTEEEWNMITIDEGNDFLLDATIHFRDGLISIGTVTLTMEELESLNYTVQVPISCNTDFTELGFGIVLDDGLTFVKGSSTAGGLCAAIANGQFVWYPIHIFNIIDAGEIGYITVEVDTAASIGDVYSLTATEFDFDGNVAAYLDNNIPFMENGAIVIAEEPIESTTTTTTAIEETTTTKPTTTTESIDASVITTTKTATETTDDTANTTILSIGDLDGDNAITINDAYNALLAYSSLSAGLDSGLTASQLAAADVDKDGKVTINDAYKILLYYATKSAGGTPSWN